MKNIYITSILVIFLFFSCITVPTPPNPAAASAVVGTAMVIKLVMPIVIAAGVGVLIAKQMKEPDRCKSPVTSEVIQYCESLKQAESMRKLNLH